MSWGFVGVRTLAGRCRGPSWIPSQADLGSGPDGDANLAAFRLYRSSGMDGARTLREYRGLL